MHKALRSESEYRQYASDKCLQENAYTHLQENYVVHNIKSTLVLKTYECEHEYKLTTTQTHLGRVGGAFLCLGMSRAQHIVRSLQILAQKQSLLIDGIGKGRFGGAEEILRVRAHYLVDDADLAVGEVIGTRAWLYAVLAVFEVDDIHVTQLRFQLVQFCGAASHVRSNCGVSEYWGA